MKSEKRFTTKKGLESDTIGGFNSLLRQQQSVDGKALITTVLFDNEYELLHDRVDIQKVRPLTEKDYTTRGTTAFLDAIGKIALQNLCKQTLQYLFCFQG